MTPEQWLNSERDYSAGALCYATYGSNINLKRVFSRPQSQYSFTKLVDELTALAGVKKVDEVVDTTSADDFVKHTVSKSPQINYSNLPPELDALVVKKGLLYKQASWTHAQLNKINDDAERLESAKIIVNNFKVIDEIWEQLDYYEKHKQLMPGKKTSDIDLEIASESQLLLKRNNLRAHISKLKKKPRRAADLLLKQQELVTVTQKLKEKYGT